MYGFGYSAGCLSASIGMCLWIVPGGGSFGGGIALFALNFIIGGVIGGFVLVWRLIVAVCYVPLTVYRLIVG